MIVQTSSNFNLLSDSRDMLCRLFSAIFQFEGVNFDQEGRSMMKKASLKLEIQRIEEFLGQR